MPRDQIRLSDTEWDGQNADEKRLRHVSWASNNNKKKRCTPWQMIRHGVGATSSLAAIGWVDIAQSATVPGRRLSFVCQ